MTVRSETRKQRYNKKQKTASIYPIEVVCPNFMCEDNIAYIIRSAACFGVSVVNVIGSLPSYDRLRACSGSTHEFVKVNTFSNPGEFLDYTEENTIQIISCELDNDSKSIYGYRFPESRICLAIGHESLGIPVEILRASNDKVFIPMPGVGYCLNTSQAANIILHEYAKQRVTVHPDLC